MEALNQKLDQFKIPIALSLVGVVLIIGGVVSSGLAKNTSSYKDKAFTKPITPIASVSLNKIKVDISGAVLSPGVYSLNKDSRIEDVLKIAGGFNSSASAEYISKRLNLSQKLSDGQKIYIPFQGDGSTTLTTIDVGSVAGVAEVGGEKDKIGLNSATTSELDSLPGVGPVTAQKIISSRPYSDLLDLLNKKVLSRTVYDKIKDLVDLN